MRKLLSGLCVAAALALTALIVHSCGIYSFSGTSIQPDVKTVTINYFEYKALRVNPSLSNELTEAIKDQFRRLTRLEEVDIEGDLEISGEITGYDVKAMAVTADEVAAQNRLTVNVKIYFTNRKYPEDDFEKSFSAYADYDSSNTLDAMESQLCEEIIEKLVEDIFNATVANW
ncbi:MAG: LptE family protein [Bacteroidetes bacterium]|uniref:LptE family protein n=1 Tax=Candidatus Cryptobacteroides intestinavium TaxID=2840766 RepID=A0A9D9MXS8_9BACT|nr:LptE family protein [Candidatus Cryptobacteroides intestinavium]